MKEKRILWLLIICLASVLLVGINELPVNIRVGSVTPQLDDTDKIAVSLYGDDAAAGDTTVMVDAAGHLQVDTLTSVTSAGKAGSINYVNEPVADTTAVILLAAPGSGVSHVIGLVAWSYDSLPDVGSTLMVTDETGTLFKVDVDESGPGYFAWIPGLKAADNDAVSVTLLAGGSGVNGIANLHTWQE